jgi:hypothetical protein
MSVCVDAFRFRCGLKQTGNVNRPSRSAFGEDRYFWFGWLPGKRFF